MSGADDVPPYQWLAAHYDELFGPQHSSQVRETFEWLVTRYGLRYRSAVDVGCGTGTFVEYLLGTGVNPVWGVDRSPAMLAQAVAKNGQNEGRFLLQDLRELRLAETVDLLTCQFETLNYLLTDEDLRTAFACFANALHPGGFAVFDVAALRPGQPEPGGRIESTTLATPSVTIRAQYDTERLLQVARVQVAAAGGIQSERHVQRIHTISDVRVALEGSGLELLAMHDSADPLQPVEQAESVIFLARRSPVAAQPLP